MGAWAAPNSNTPLLLGCDFSSRPTRKKPIVLASGALVGHRLVLQQLHEFFSVDDLSAWLSSQPTWLGGFDLPFGLPRELVQTLGWPQDWAQCMAHYTQLSRESIRDTFAAFCNARPVGHKFAHRATDRLAQSSPSMKWVNPPVAYMLHAGVPCLLKAQAYLAGVMPLPAEGVPAQAQPPRVALEAYPGLLARELLGAQSYKSDDPAKQTPERLIARKHLVHGLELGSARLGLRLKLSHTLSGVLVQDASADRLDAVLCLMQAAWAHLQGPPHFGLPEDVDLLEGWIVSA